MAYGLENGNGASRAMQLVPGTSALSLLLSALLAGVLFQNFGGLITGGRGFSFGALLYVLLSNALHFLPLLITALRVGRFREAGPAKR